MTPLTNSQYQTEVQNYPGSVILLFTALWDNAGIKTRVFLNSLPLSNVKIFSVDFDTERELVTKFSVRQLPEIYGLKAGEIMYIGPVCETEAEYKDILDTIL